LLPLLSGLLLLPQAALAAGYSAVDDNAWTLELHQGPVVGSVRVLGLGGAYVGVGEGVEGLLYNPASLGNRTSRSQDWFEWDATIDWLVLGSLGETDFFNDGPLEARYSELMAGLFGAGFQLGRLGVGLAGRFQTFWVGSGPPVEGEEAPEVKLDAQDGKVAMAGVFDLFRYQEALVLGLGLRFASLTATEQGGEGEALTLLQGASLEGGLLWRPPGERWRFGAVLRLPTRGTREEVAEAEGEPVPNRFGARHLPDTLVAPWELAVGLSWMFGPFGPSYNSKRKAVRIPVPGRRLLVAADVVVTGAVERAEASRATGMSGFVEQRLVPARDRPSLSLRAGVERDLFPTRLRVRGGAYLEPARFEGVDARPHLTGGADLRLFHLWGYDLRLSVVFDVARRYNNTALSVGLWHWPMATQ